MTRLERCEYFKRVGYKYNPETGEIRKNDKLMGTQRKDGRNVLTTTFNKKVYRLFSYHYAWFYVYGNLNFQQIDHINRNPSDDRIKNLRIVTHQQNQFNKNGKGYYFDKKVKKFNVQIMVNKKSIFGGYFEKEEDARLKYLELKDIYHNI